MANPAVPRWASVRLPSSPRFHKPPCDPGRSGFPIPVLTLVQPQRSPSQNEASLSADSHPPQLIPVYFPGRSVVHRPWIELVRLLLEPPSAQSPFARSRCDLSRRGCLRHVSERYPAVIATTSSCASPTPSHRLWSQPRSAGLRRSLSAPAGHSTFPALPPRILPQMPGPLPRRSPWCTHSFLPTEHRPSPFPNWVGTPQNPYNDVSTAVGFEAAAIHSCSGLRVCSPPRSFPPQRSLRVRRMCRSGRVRWVSQRFRTGPQSDSHGYSPNAFPLQLGSRGFYVHAHLGLLPRRAVDMLAVRIEQLTAEGLSPSKTRGHAGRS